MNKTHLILKFHKKKAETFTFHKDLLQFLFLFFLFSPANWLEESESEKKIYFIIEEETAALFLFLGIEIGIIWLTDLLYNCFSLVPFLFDYGSKFFTFTKIFVFMGLLFGWSFGKQ